MNWSAGARPYWKKTNPAKAAARSIQNPVQAIAALKPITGERRWSPRSRANMAKTKRLNPIQNARECAIRLVQQCTGRKKKSGDRAIGSSGEVKTERQCCTLRDRCLQQSGGCFHAAEGACVSKG